jgi:DNA repair protein RecO (recombination protein O)
MSLKKTDAIVLRSIKQGETSKILILYSRNFGKIKVIAKGARGAKSRYGGTLEPPNCIAIVYYEKETRDLQFLSQADLIEPFYAIKKDLVRTGLAMAVCELVSSATPDHEANPLLFKLQLASLQSIDKNSDPVNVFRSFEARLFENLGFRPDFTACLQCGRQGTGDVHFTFEHGGFSCSDCHNLSIRGMNLSGETIAGLRRLQITTFPNLDSIVMTDTVQAEVDRFLDRYLKYHVEDLRDLKSLEFLRKIT